MQESTTIRFGRFELQPGHRRLLSDGEQLSLGARPFDLLVALVERCDRVVTKADLMDQVWPGLVVEENNLQVQVSLLRKVLGAQVIATIPGRGYQFIATINDTADETSSSLVERPALRASPDNPAASPQTNLPSSLPRLYGRETDLSALRALLDVHQAVTVVGTGGIGKSRLAQMVAHSQTGNWPDGTWMVELAGLTDPVLLPSAVAHVLGIQLSGQAAALNELVAQMAQRTLLLVLDNCEHLLDAVVALVQATLLDAPGVTLLLTSQTPLHLPSEQQYRLMPLAVPPEKSTFGARAYGAVALFEARVQAVDPRFALSDEGLVLAIDICRRLDGLPLAIELAAARVRALGLHTVRDKLDERFKLLTGGSRATLRRHHTLRAVIEWSHTLLDDAEKAVFRRLGVFAGGFTMQLAQSVAGDAQLDEWAVLDHLSALVDKSLVVADAGDLPRYRLLESARAFALEQLAAGESAETLKRHAHALLEFLERVDGAKLDCELRSDQYTALVLPELDNLRAARAWANGETGDPQVAVALAAYASSLIDYAVECVDWLLPLQKHVKSGPVDPAVAARYWGTLAAPNMTGHVLRTVQVDAAGRALSAYRTAGQPRRVYSSLVNLARHLGRQRQDAAAQVALDEAQGLIRPDWPVELHFRLRLLEASLARGAGRLSEALARIHDAVRVGASSGDWRLEVMARNNLVDLLWELGPIDEAERVACKLAEEFRTKPAADGDLAVLLANLMGIQSEIGRIDEASTVAREAIPIMRRARYSYIEEWLYLFWRRGQLDTAAVLLGASDAERLRYGTPHQENERRLTAQVRAGLEAQMDSDAFASHLAKGAALQEGEWLPLVSEALAQPNGSLP